MHQKGTTMSFNASIVDAAANLHNNVEGGGTAWTAVCGLEGTVRRLSSQDAAAALHSVMALSNVIYRMDDDQAARAIVGVEALIQGLCPVEAWAQWSRLNGC